VALPSIEAVPSTGIVPLGQPLLERVRPVPGYEDLTRALLTGVNLVDDLRDVLRVYPEGRLPAMFVTPAGDLLAPDGVIRGGASGAAGEGGHIARVREVRDLETEVAEIERRVTADERAHTESRSALGAAADELENLRNRHHTAALAVANHEKDLERTRERAKALGEVHEGRVVERSEILAESQSLAAERVRLQKALEDSRRDRGTRQRALDGLGLRIGTAGRELNRLETLATEQRVEHAERLERLSAAHDRAAAALGETQTWIERRNGEIEGAEARREELAGSIEEAGAILETRLRDEESARMGHDEKREAFERVSFEVNELDDGVRELRADIGGRRERLSASELQLRESEMKLAHLDESVREKWSVEIATWSPPALDPAPAAQVVAGPEAAEETASPGDAAQEEAGATEATSPVGVQRDAGEEEESAPDAAREARANAELARLPSAERREHLEAVRKKMQGLGEVNLGAIEEHEELSERQRFLTEQKDDLENRTSRRRFRETFEAVSKRFSENFPRLFRGGRASLSLTESEDVLEAACRSPSPRTCSRRASTSWPCRRANASRTSTCSPVARRR
jgi:chromosome segregation protein